MFEKCRICGKKAVTAGLCVMCFGMSSITAEAVTASVTHHATVVVIATPPSESDPPHVAEQDFDPHIAGPEMAAGSGGTGIQGTVNLSGEGTLTAGGASPAGASLSGEGHLTAAAAIAPAAHLAGEGNLTAGGPVSSAAELSGAGSLTAG
jgi:hypothetical protein